MLDPAPQVRRPREFRCQKGQTQRNHQEARSGQGQQRRPDEEQGESSNDFRVPFHRGVAAAMDEMSGFGDNGDMESHHE